MSRPLKWRKVCCMPKMTRFGPLDEELEQKLSVVMTIDEYETIRLIDFEHLTQEECSSLMNIARTTVQGIYTEARRKLAESIVDGKILFIDGGEYRLCDGTDHKCRRECRKKMKYTKTDNVSD